MGCSLPGSSVPGILQARTLERVAISLSRGSFPPRDRTLVCYLAGGFSTTEPVEGKLRFLTLTRLLPTGRAGTQGKVPLGTWILDGAELPHSLVGLKRSKRQKTCLNKHPLQAVPQPTLAHHPQGGFTENPPHTNRTLRPPCGLGSPAPRQEGAHGVVPLAQPGGRQRCPKEKGALLASVRTQPAEYLGPTARHLRVNLKFLTFCRAVMKQTKVLEKEQRIFIFLAFSGIGQYCFKVNKSANGRQ